MAKRERFEWITVNTEDTVCTARNLEGRAIIYTGNCLGKGHRITPEEIIQKLKKGLPYTEIIEYKEIRKRYVM